MVQETWVQSQVGFYQRFLKWYLIPLRLTLSIIGYISRVKAGNPGKRVASSPTFRCSSYWKGSLQVALDYGHQLFLLCIDIAAIMLLIFFRFFLYFVGPVGWGFRNHRVHLSKEVKLPYQRVSQYDIKLSDDEASVLLVLWWMQSVSSLLLLPGQLWPGVVALDRVLSKGWNRT